jgi:hypothetical protein
MIAPTGPAARPVPAASSELNAALAPVELAIYFPDLPRENATITATASKSQNVKQRPHIVFAPALPSLADSAFALKRELSQIILRAPSYILLKIKKATTASTTMTRSELDEDAGFTAAAGVASVGAEPTLV